MRRSRYKTPCGFMLTTCESWRGTFVGCWPGRKSGGMQIRSAARSRQKRQATRSVTTCQAALSAWQHQRAVEFPEFCKISGRWIQNPEVVVCHDLDEEKVFTENWKGSAATIRLFWPLGFCLLRCRLVGKPRAATVGRRDLARYQAMPRHRILKRRFHRTTEGT